jgi:hypothetical protein
MTSEREENTAAEIIAPKCVKLNADLREQIESNKCDCKTDKNT